MTKCSLKTRQCTLQLNKLQIINYCEFVERYLFDLDDFKMSMQSILKECLSIKSFNEDQYWNKSVMYLKNEMPIRFNNMRAHIAQSRFWKVSTDYSNVINKLRSSMCKLHFIFISIYLVWL